MCSFHPIVASRLVDITLIAIVHICLSNDLSPAVNLLPYGCENFQRKKCHKYPGSSVAEFKSCTFPCRSLLGICSVRCPLCLVTGIRGHSS